MATAAKIDSAKLSHIRDAGRKAAVIRAVGRYSIPKTSEALGGEAFFPLAEWDVRVYKVRLPLLRVQ